MTMQLEFRAQAESCCSVVSSPCEKCKEGRHGGHGASVSPWELTATPPLAVGLQVTLNLQAPGGLVCPHTNQAWCAQTQALASSHTSQADC